LSGGAGVHGVCSWAGGCPAEGSGLVSDVIGAGWGCSRSYVETPRFVWSLARCWVLRGRRALVGSGLVGSGLGGLLFSLVAVMSCLLWWVGGGGPCGR
jgi:hypothetical protein